MLKNLLYLSLYLSSLILMNCSNSAKYGTVLDIAKPELKQGFNPGRLREITTIPNSIATLLMPQINNIELASVNHINNQLEKRFNIVADNATAKSFFLQLVEGTSFNVIVHPEVQGVISMSLKNVTVNDVLEAVQKIYGYGFEYAPQTVRIFPVSLQTRVFKLNYLDLVRAGNSSTTITGASASFSNSSNSSSGSSNSSTSSNNSNNTDSITSKVSTTSSTDLWDQILKSLQAMIGVGSEKTGEGKRVAISKMAGMIVVTAYPNELQKIEQFLLDTERSLNKQVMLEAKVIEVILNDGYRSGINWAVLNDHMQASQIGNDLNKVDNISVSSSITDASASSGNSSQIDLTTGMHHMPPVIPNTVTAFGGLLTLGINYRKLATFVELLAAQGNVQVLSSPRITTSNNQKALIKVGSDSYFITNISTATTTSVGTTAGQSNSATSTPTVTLNPFFSGIALDVTPQIGEDDITLHIHPTISTVDSNPIDIPGTAGKVPLAKSTVRESDSIVRAKNGQLIVIGGLMQDKTAELITGIPFLKDIPFVGAVFRHTRQQATKSELVILLRPVILDDYKTKTQLQNSYNRLNELDRGFHVGGGAKWYGNLGETQ
jgi:MSHA biogenesis protein MshL